MARGRRGPRRPVVPPLLRGARRGAGIDRQHPARRAHRQRRHSNGPGRARSHARPGVRSQPGGVLGARRGRRARLRRCRAARQEARPVHAGGGARRGRRHGRPARRGYRRRRGGVRGVGSGTGGLGGEHQRPRPGRHRRPSRGRGARGEGGGGAGRTEERDAAGERPVPLGPDEARRGPPRRRDGSGGSEPAARARRAKRGRRADDGGRRGQALPAPAGREPGAVERLRRAVAARGGRALLRGGAGPRAQRSAQAHARRRARRGRRRSSLARQGLAAATAARGAAS